MHRVAGRGQLRTHPAPAFLELNVMLLIALANLDRKVLHVGPEAGGELLLRGCEGRQRAFETVPGHIFAELRRRRPDGYRQEECEKCTFHEETAFPGRRMGRMAGSTETRSGSFWMTALSTRTPIELRGFTEDLRTQKRL